MTNKELFTYTLKGFYEALFETPQYVAVSKRYTPDALAAVMVDRLCKGTADKDGEGIKQTCKAVGIKYTYSAIRDYLNHGN